MSVDVEKPFSALMVPQEQVLTPAEQFGAHVEYVRQNGDAFDQRPQLGLRHVVRIAATSAGVGAVAAPVEHSSTAGWAFAAAATAASFVSQTVVSGRADKKNVPYARQAFGGKGAPIHNDSFYELFSVKGLPGKKSEVAMRWYGPEGERAGEYSGHDELVRNAELAKEYGVAKLVIGRSLAEQCGDKKFPGRAYTMEQWLWKRKHMPTKGPTEVDVVHEATPDQWLAYADASKTNEITDSGAYVVSSIADIKAAAEGIKPSAVTARQKPEPLTAQSHYSVQQAIAIGVRPEGRPQPKLRGRTLVAAAFAGAVLGMGAGVVQGGFDNMLDHRKQEATADIARQNGAQPELADVDPKAVDKMVHDWSFLNGPWDAWQGARDRVQKNLQFEPNDSPKGKPTAKVNGGLSIEDDHDTRPVWTVAAHNMPDTALTGNWSQATSSELVAAKKPGEIPTLEWRANTRPYDPRYPGSWTSTTGIAEPDPELSKKWIQVDADGSKVQLSTTVTDAPKELFKGGKLDMMAVPVPDGMGMIAANQDGKKLDWIVKPDGTTSLIFDADNKYHDGRITYYVEPDEFYSASNGPRAIAPVTQLKLADGTPQMPIDTAAIRAELAARIPGVEHMTTQQIADYLHNNLGYKKAPLSIDELKRLQSLDELMGDVIDPRRTDCGYAASTLILGNMSVGGQNLNAVIGYLNSGDTHVLDMSEYHLRAVGEGGPEQRFSDSAGKLYDATPSQQMKPLVGVSPERADKSRGPIPTEPLLFLGALNLAGAAVYVNRRGIQRGITRRSEKWVARTEADRQAALAELHALPAVELRQAEAVIRSAWAPADKKVSSADIASQIATDPGSKDRSLQALVVPSNAYRVAPRIHDDRALSKSVRRTVALAQDASPRIPQSTAKRPTLAERAKAWIASRRV